MTLTLALCLAAPADAGKRKGKNRRARKAKAPVAAPVVEPTPAPLAEPTPAPDVSGLSVDALMTEAKAAYKALDYDRVLPLVEALLKREGLTPEQKLDAYLLQGTSLAVIGDPIEAETPFRLLLRGRPDFDLSAETAPKILAVFRKVQVEERAIAEQLRTLERQRIISQLKLIGEMPKRARGGEPLSFGFRLRDPGNAVEQVFIQYRRQGEPSYSALALQRDDAGAWRGSIPGELTASADGFVLEFYLETSDAEGTLLASGNTNAPHNVEVEAGEVDLSGPPPLPLWAFVVPAASAGALALASVGTGVGTLLVQAEYDAMGEQSRTEETPGDVMSDVRQTGDALAITTTVLWVATGLAALTAGGLAPFVDWRGEAEEAAP